MSFCRILLAAAATLWIATGAAAKEPELDAFTGLRMTGDWELVRANCIACHSSKLITQQSGTAQQWLGMIRWMQEKQNLWQFEPAVEAKIVTYLADNYPPSADRRRAAVPPDLMPPNPYAPKIVAAPE
jgi:mono/diheme cytochrome c family protein